MEQEIILSVGVGDVVKVDFIDGEVLTAKILQVNKRFGFHNEGTTKTNDLAQIEVLEVEKPHPFLRSKNLGDRSWIDVGYIKEIIERNPSKFSSQKYLENPKHWQFVERKKSTLIGNLSSLLNDLWIIYYGDPEVLDIKKALKLYHLQGNPGFIRKVIPPYMIIEVRRKSFLKWFFQNRNKFLRKYSEIHAEQTAINNIEEEMYWNDLKKDLFKED